MKHKKSKDRPGFSLTKEAQREYVKILKSVGKLVRLGFIAPVEEPHGYRLLEIKLYDSEGKVIVGLSSENEEGSIQSVGIPVEESLPELLARNAGEVTRTLDNILLLKPGKRAGSGGT